MSPDKKIKKGNGWRNNQQTLTDSDKESLRKLLKKTVRFLLLILIVVGVPLASVVSPLIREILHYLLGQLWNLFEGLWNLLGENVKILGIYDGPFNNFLLLVIVARSFILFILRHFPIREILYHLFTHNGGQAGASQENGEVKQQEAKEQLKPGDIFRDCDGCPEMVVVPAGSFMMGSPDNEEGRYDQEIPQHLVTISKPFAVGKYEVTRRQFADFIASTGHDASNKWLDPGFEQNDAHPVVAVLWDDANKYLSWLSAQTGHQYRLLSDVEWEYAARAGTITRYHFGDMIFPEQANYGKNKGGTVEVGSYPANAFGLYDMHGNVWEWVEDCWHDDYKGAPTDGSAWVSDCDRDGRVLRGGSWSNSPQGLRSAIRAQGKSIARNYIGFRVARTLEP